MSKSDKNKTLYNKVDQAVKTTRKELEDNLEVPENLTIDLDIENYIRNPERCKIGSLLRLKKDIDDFFELQEEKWALGEFKAGDAVLVLHSFENKNTGAVVFVTLNDVKMYLHHTFNFEEDFEILSKGTINKNDNK